MQMMQLPMPKLISSFAGETLLSHSDSAFSFESLQCHDHGMGTRATHAVPPIGRRTK